MRIELEVGPEVGKLVRRLRRRFADELFDHLLRNAVLGAALRQGEQINLTKQEEIAAQEEIIRQLKGDE